MHVIHRDELEPPGDVGQPGLFPWGKERTPNLGDPMSEQKLRISFGFLTCNTTSNAATTALSEYTKLIYVGQTWGHGWTYIGGAA